MSNTAVNPTEIKLQEMSREWAKQFEGNAPMEVHFLVNPEGLLEVNGFALCPISDIDADSSDFDVEFFYIYTHTGSYFEIYLHCPEEGPGEIGTIEFITPVYYANAILALAE